MNFELYIENLGAIEKAEMTINPLTILAGENGTGKSFVTKFLYSVLNVLMRDVYKSELINIFDEMERNHKELKDFLSESLFSDFGMFLVKMRDRVSYSVDILKENFQDVDNKIIEYIDKYGEFLNKLNISKTEFNNSLSKIKDLGFKSDVAKNLMIESILSLFRKNILILKNLQISLKNIRFNYFQILENYISFELKSNFQISEINQLIKKGKEKLIFKIKGVIQIEIEKNSFTIINQFDDLISIKNIYRLVFFESSIYWRLSKDLIENSSRPQTYYLSDKISDERLTGIPKHFLDLRDLVFANFKNGERPKFIEQCANDLQKSLNGKFNTDSYDLSFETNQGQTISKNLVSFGMTNLGILQAVLNKNIINKGSFVFIDEPESNLHPEWQAVLADILVKLAENGVFVVITTHSSDMLKALDVISQEGNNKENFVSVNYFEKGGLLADLNNDNANVIQQARLKLLETYDELVLRGYLL